MPALPDNYVTNVTAGARRDFTGATTSKYVLTLTMTCRVMLQSAPSAGNNAYLLNIKSSANSFTLGRTWYLGSAGANTFNVQMIYGGDATSFNRWLSSTALPFGRLINLAAVMKANMATDGTAATLFVDGVEDSGSTNASSSLTPAALSGSIEMFDRALDGLRKFGGTVKNLCVWNIALNAAQAAAVAACNTDDDLLRLGFIEALVARMNDKTGKWEEFDGSFPESTPLDNTDTGTITTTNLSDDNYPTSLPTPAMMYLATQGVYTNAAGTVAASALADRIRLVRDRSGSGFSLTQDSDGLTPNARPYYLPADGARPAAIVHDNTLNNCFFDFAAGPYIHTQAATIVMIGRMRMIGRSYRPVLYNSALEVAGSTTGAMRMSGTDLGVTVCDTPSVHIWRAETTKTVASRNTWSAEGSALAAAGSSAAGYIGRSSTLYADMAWNAILVYTQALTAAQEATIRTWASTQGWVTNEPTDGVILVGTSSMVGTGPDYCRDLAYLLAPSLMNVRFFNLAVGGEVVADQITNRASVQAVLARELALTGKKPAVLVWCGSNDLYVSGDTPATVSGNLDTLLGYYAGYGATKIGLVTILPRGTVGSADNDDRVAYNALLKAKGRRVADPASDSRIQDGAQTATTYYTSGESSPRTHLNVTGMGIVATDHVGPMVRGLLGGGRRRRLALLLAAGR